MRSLQIRVAGAASLERQAGFARSEVENSRKARRRERPYSAGGSRGLRVRSLANAELSGKAAIVKMREVFGCSKAALTAAGAMLPNTSLAVMAASA